MAITLAPYGYADLFHALRATGPARPVPRGLPPLAYPPASSSHPWLVWFLGGVMLGALLPHRDAWGDRLSQALSLGMWGVVLGGAWRTRRWLLRRHYHATSLADVGLGSQLAFGFILVGLPCLVVSELGHLPLFAHWWLVGAPLLGGLATPLVLGLLTHVAEGRAAGQARQHLTLPTTRVITAARQQPLPFGLWLGQSTGILTALGGRAAGGLTPRFLRLSIRIGKTARPNRACDPPDAGAAEGEGAAEAVDAVLRLRHRWLTGREALAMPHQHGVDNVLRCIKGGFLQAAKRRGKVEKCP